MFKENPSRASTYVQLKVKQGIEQAPQHTDICHF